MPRHGPPARLACIALLLAACTTPPPEAYIALSTPAAAAGEAAGQDTRGESCQVQQGRAPPADFPVLRAQSVYCGGWTQPAARIVELRGGTSGAELDRLAQGGLWRSWLDQRLVCGPPSSTTLSGGVPARLLPCTRRQGGWPHVAMVIAGPRGPVVADGVATSVPVIERLATGQASTAPNAARGGRSAALELAVARLSAEAFGVADVGRYETLMALGRDLNQAENFAAAEDAYRAALAVQERVLGANAPDTANALMHLALNLSNQQRRAEAEALLLRADALVPRAADPAARARLQHYRALMLLNNEEPQQAMDLLVQAEASYAALLPPGYLARDPVLDEPGANLLADPIVQTAVLGLAEARRNRAIALARLGRAQEAPAVLAEGRALLRRAGLEPNMMVGRALRTEAGAAGSLGRDETAARLLEQAAGRFAIAAPGERPEAVTLFLTGQRRTNAGRRADALSAFRAGAAILRARQIALPVELIIPYLDALDAEARAEPGSAAARRAEMFAAAQLAQRSGTVRVVQQATARLSAGAGDARVSESVRRLQDADRDLRALFSERDARGTVGSAVPEALDRRIADAQALRAEAEAEVAAAAPGYRQLLLAATDADAVARVLRPNEALVTMLLGRSHGYVMAVRGGLVSASRINASEAAVQRQVTTLREAIAPAGGAGGPGRFDSSTAAELYRVVLAPVEQALAGAETLIVAPDGPLLALPFGLLLTGPANDLDLRAAPWLIRRHAIIHIPSPQTFVTLRNGGPGSPAPLPYAGFGDFVPASAAQLARSFPPERCATDARLAQGLGRLPGTRPEVQLAAQTLGAGPGAIHLGAEFTAAGLRNARLDQARVVHFAAHALLPGELSCMQEPSIVLSPPPGAASAEAAFMRSSEMLNLKLDADLVILSACNTGGPGGAGGGEALSGLARAFFYAGARGLMVTHWAVDDAAATLTVADTLRRQQSGAASASALRGAQLLLLDEAGKRLPAAFAHPYYWAPFVLIGEGRRVTTGQTAAIPAAPTL